MMHTSGPTRRALLFRGSRKHQLLHRDELQLNKWCSIKSDATHPVCKGW
jgi:hypothetical protein